VWRKIEASKLVSNWKVLGSMRSAFSPTLLAKTSPPKQYIATRGFSRQRVSCSWSSKHQGKWWPWKISMAKRLARLSPSRGRVGGKTAQLLRSSPSSDDETTVGSSGSRAGSVLTSRRTQAPRIVKRGEIRWRGINLPELLKVQILFRIQLRDAGWAYYSTMSSSCPTLDKTLSEGSEVAYQVLISGARRLCACSLLAILIPMQIRKLTTYPAPLCNAECS
jgi:hypothetical protein